MELIYRPSMALERDKPLPSESATPSEMECENQQIIVQPWEITLTKECIRKGQGVMRPVYGSVCSVRSITEAVEIDMKSTNETNSIMKVHIGDSDTKINSVIDSCLLTMTEGEISKFTEVSKRGSNVDNKDVKRNEIPEPLSTTTTDLKLELLSIDEMGIPPWKIAHEDKLSKAVALKERGNLLFRNGDINIAFSRYSRAVKLLISMLPESTIPDDIFKDFTQARCHCYLNLAACQMKTKNWRSVTENCSKVLELQPNNVKALYRRGVAHQHCDNFSSAKADLHKCLNLEPKNKTVLIALKEMADNSNDSQVPSL